MELHLRSCWTDFSQEKCDFLNSLNSLEVRIKGNGRGRLLSLMAASLRVALFNDAPVLARPSLKMKLERMQRTGRKLCPDDALYPASSVRSTVGVSAFFSTLETDWAPSAFSPH